LNLKLSILFTLLIITTGCNKDKLPRLNQNAKIIAFGDSLTFGVGSNNGHDYPHYLAELSSYQVINSGISGETTTQGLMRFQATLDKHSPELIILLEGGNDILRNHSASKTKQNLAQMIEMAQLDNISVILIGVPEKKLFSDSAPFYSELAEQYDLVFAEELLSDLLRTSKYKSDPIHLNSAGYKKLAEGIYQLLLENGAVN
jgi:acyl-CoA thioesterase I